MICASTVLVFMKIQSIVFYTKLLTDRQTDKQTYTVCEILRKFDIDSLYICPPYLYTVATLLWEIQKSYFQRYYSYILQIIYVILEKTNCYPLTHHT